MAAAADVDAGVSFASCDCCPESSSDDAAEARAEAGVWAECGPAVVLAAASAT